MLSLIVTISLRYLVKSEQSGLNSKHEVNSELSNNEQEAKLSLG